VEKRVEFMPRPVKPLTTLLIKNLKGPKAKSDGGGLIMRVDRNHNKRWLFRYRRDGRDTDVPLGSWPTVSLEAARKAAQLERERLAVGITGRATFRQVFEKLHEHHVGGLRNDKHKVAWRKQVETYAAPLLDMQVANIRASDIKDALSKVWHEKPETASRVFQRIEKTFKAAIADDLLAASPCDKARTLLGPLKKSTRNHPSMPYKDVPGFMTQLRTGAIAAEYLTRLALEFVILTAARSGEVRNMPRAEIDLDKRIWVVPAERMKMDREHKVPLSSRAIEIVQEADRLRGETLLTFPAPSGGAMSDMTLLAVLRRAGLAEVATVHGFRSSFKMWCAEAEKVPDEVSERALAHIDGNESRAAYLRSDFLEQRAPIMERWAQYLSKQ
jgi:integrase